MSDDLRASLESAFAADAAGTLDSTPAPDAGAELPEAPAVEAPRIDAPTDDRPRNADGTFAPKPAAPEAPETPAAPTAAPADKPAVAAPPAPATDRIAPPENWKGAAKVRWDGLPKAIQQEIVADYGRIGQIDGQLSALKQVIDPVRVQYAAEYGSVESAIRQLISLEQFARQNPEQFIQQFAQARGIQLPGAAQAQQPYIDPALAPVFQPLQQEVQTLRQQLAAVQAHTQQQVYDSTLQTVGQFIADSAHPFAAEVAPEMTRLIEAGAVQRGPDMLQKAYEMATWSNPTVRAQLLDLERETKQKADQQRVEAARRAGTSLNGSPIPGANPNAANPAPTIREELERQFAASRV